MYHWHRFDVQTQNYNHNAMMIEGKIINHFALHNHEIKVSRKPGTISLVVRTVFKHLIHNAEIRSKIQICLALSSLLEHCMDSSHETVMRIYSYLHVN